MTYRILLIMTAVMALVCGIAFVGWGPTLLPYFGVGSISIPEHEVYIWRKTVGFTNLFGALLVSVGAFAWLMRNLDRPGDQRRISAAFFVGSSLLLIIAFNLQRALPTGTMGWIAIYTILFLVLVDDHRVVSRGVRSYLESFPDITIVGIAANGEELLKSLDQWSPEVIVMDLLMPGGMDGIEATRRVRARTPRIQVIALTASIDDARLIGALRAGAIGYVRKDAEPEVLLTAVRAAARGHSLIDPSVAGTVLHEMVHGQVPGNELTDRELEVLRQLVRGYTNREIAEALLSVKRPSKATSVTSSVNFTSRIAHSS